MPPRMTAHTDPAGVARGRVFRARTPIELMLKVYKHHGWPVALGRMAARFAEHYDMTIDHPRSRYVATPRAHPTPDAPPTSTPTPTPEIL